MSPPHASSMLCLALWGVFLSSVPVIGYKIDDLRMALRDAAHPIRDRPDPPVNVRLERCTSDSADVSWDAGDDNNAEITQYTMYYNTTFEPDAFHKSATLVGDASSARIYLSPWMNYTFHMVAHNSEGVSDVSGFTGVCSTPSDIPYYNPDDVCTESRGETDLVITWKPVEPIDLNAPGFRYIVSYRRLSDPDFTEVHVNDRSQAELTVPNQETFVKYEIYVKSQNSVGSARRLPHHIYGYSGEGVPEDAPHDLLIEETSLTATSVILHWRPVNQEPAVMRGMFAGYEINYWPISRPDEVRVHDVMVYPEGFCEVINGDGVTAGDNNVDHLPDVSSANILDLWPFETIELGIRVRNTRHSGPLSSTITFTTLERRS